VVKSDIITGSGEHKLEMAEKQAILGLYVGICKRNAAGKADFVTVGIVFEGNFPLNYNPFVAAEIEPDLIAVCAFNPKANVKGHTRRHGVAPFGGANRAQFYICNHFLSM
jgi:hypothetical protein